MPKPTRVKPKREFSFDEFVTGKRVSAKRFAKPLKGKPRKNPFLESGLQTIVGKRTRTFAANYHGVSEQTIKALINGITEKIELVNVGSEVAKKHYAKQTAEDIFRTRKILVSYYEGKTKDGTPYIYPAFGCNALCVALSAALRAKAIPTVFVRLNKDNFGNLGVVQGVKHAVVLFHLGKKWFLADPFERNLEKRMLEVTSEMRERFAEMESKGLLAVGKDSWGLGITSYYGKYSFIKRTSFFQAKSLEK